MITLGEKIDQFTESRVQKSVDHFVHLSVPRDEFSLTVKRLKQTKVTQGRLLSNQNTVILLKNKTYLKNTMLLLIAI